MLDNSKKSILDRNPYISRRRNARMNDRLLTQRRICFLVGCLLGFVAVIAIYLASPASKLFTISVSGNSYLKDEYIKELSGVKDDDHIFTVFSSSVERDLEKSPFIEEAKAELIRGRVLSITVEEKKQIGYMNDSDGVKIVFADGSKELLDPDLLHLITGVPYIDGFLSDDQFAYVVKAFRNLDEETIDQISEVHRYPFSYDENMMEFIMRDGNYVFVSWSGADLLEDYYLMVSGVASSERVCLYLDEMTNSGFTSSCPWEKTAEETVVADDADIDDDDID